MNNDHAKLVLSVYRPHGQDADNPFFAEALQQAKMDPSLSAWFRDEQRFDAEFAATLGAVATPTNAKNMIKATMGASTRRRRRWWPLAIAASVAVMLATSLLFKHRPTGLPLPANATIAQLATNLADHHGSIGLMSQDFARVRQWISERGGPLPDDLPAGLAKMMVLGCETWKTTRGKVSLVCFVGEGKQMVHLYIFENAADHPGLPDIAHPRLEKEGKWALALWQNHGRAYVLGAPVDSGLTVESFFRT
ncbi:MAG: hypothetical protein A3G75_08080 [Verrucomicrobia bacterium RIFCSPLOWO2_12_FULL_64_8]|nr:MAG: hypothetical protein A3G75_08080 [Verrucomicrobia bacterium RIFCSPLOWO2_12_FULL_64_8]